ncbi:MAG: SAM-dependent chlorinase/fluorinase [Planctomycetes bacterium]|nr:SAM-dependent chlorinase/fluorinase [Planctomycetota bacterium]
MLAGLAGCRVHRVAAPGVSASPPRVVLLTDFGTRDDSVALLRGVILSIAPDAQVLDLTHDVPPYDVEEGARLLEEAPGLYPAGTVFVAVVDPGVGTERKPIAAELANGVYLVGPDNGLLSRALSRHGVRRVREIADPRFVRRAVSSTFHGRDVFAPAGAHLAARWPSFDQLGPEVHAWQRLEAPVVELVRPAGASADAHPTALRAVVVAFDEPFGNVWTNVEPADLEKLVSIAVAAEKGTPPAPPAGTPRPDAVGLGTTLRFTLGEPPVQVLAPLVRTFGDVPEKQPLAYWNSRGRLALALNMGDAARTWSVRRGAPVRLELSPSPTR